MLDVALTEAFNLLSDVSKTLRTAAHETNYFIPNVNYPAVINSNEEINKTLDTHAHAPVFSVSSSMRLGGEASAARPLCW